VDLNRLVELGEFNFLDQGDGLFELILFGLYLFESVLILLTWFTSLISSLVQAVRKKGIRTSH